MFIVLSYVFVYFFILPYTVFCFPPFFVGSPFQNVKVVKMHHEFMIYWRCRYRSSEWVNQNSSAYPVLSIFSSLKEDCVLKFFLFAHFTLLLRLCGRIQEMEKSASVECDECKCSKEDFEKSQNMKEEILRPYS